MRLLDEPTDLKIPQCHVFPVFLHNLGTFYAKVLFQTSQQATERKNNEKKKKIFGHMLALVHKNINLSLISTSCTIRLRTTLQTQVPVRYLI